MTESASIETYRIYQKPDAQFRNNKRNRKYRGRDSERQRVIIDGRKKAVQGTE